MTSIDGRTYCISRDRWQRVRCDVDEGCPGPSRQLESPVVYGGGSFDVGNTLGAADLALAILLDHAVVVADTAKEVFRTGFHTPDIRLLYCWMNHLRLREQRLCDKSGVIVVTEWELYRLIDRGFLTSQDEENHLSHVAKVESEQSRWMDDAGNYHRQSRAGEHVAPLNKGVG